MDKPRVVVETTESTNVGYLGFALDVFSTVEGHALRGTVGILFGYGRDGEFFVCCLTLGGWRNGEIRGNGSG